MDEHNLKDREKPFRSIVDKLQISTVYREKEQIYLNNKAEKTTGYKSEEIKTVHEWFEKLYGKHAKDMKNLYDYDRSQGFHEPRTVEILTKSGETRLIEFFVYEEQEHAIWIMHDITEKTKTEILLKENQIKLLEANHIMTAVLEHTHMMAVLLDPQFNFIWVNRAYAEVCKYSQSFFPGKNHFSLYPHEENQRIFQKVVDTGEPFYVYAKPFEFPDQPDRGITFWDWSLIPVKDENSQVAGLVFTLTEVTEKIKAEESLSEHEKELQWILKSMLNAFVIFESVFDDTGNFISYRFVYINDAYEKITGVKNNDVRGKTVHEVWPETEPEWIRRYGEVAVSGISQVFDMYHKPTDKLYHCNVYRPWDNKDRFCVIFEDITERKKAETDLIESEKRFRSYIENAPDGIFLADERGNYILVNAAACSLTGFTREELLQKNLKDLVFPDDIYLGLEHFRTVVEHGNASGEIRFVTKSGQVRNFIVKAVKLDEKNFLGFTVDITERKLMEEKLKSTYIKLESLWSIASMTDSDIKTISDHILLSITKMTGSKYGFYGFINEDESVMTIHSWSGNAMTDCSIMDKPSLFPIKEAGIWGEAIRKRKPFIMNDYNEYREIKKGLPEGHVKITRLLVVPFFFQGKITSVAAVANRHMPYNHEDITQITSFLSSIQAVVEHKKSEEFLSLMADILDEAPGSITVHDFTGSFIYANRKTFEMHGYNKEEFMALRVEDIDVPESKALFKERAEKINRYGEASFDLCHSRKDGTLIPLAIFARKIIWKNIPAILSIATDITERKAAEDEKEKLRSQLLQAQKMESIGRLAGGVAHDFNNMLGIILGFTELALEDIEPGNSLYESLKGIEKAAHRSADLTRQLLAFARKQTIAPKVLDINDTVSGMLKMIRRLIGEDINLIWMPGANLWPVLVDPAQVDQILANLCVNARDAIKEVGKITIITENIMFDTAVHTYNTDFRAGEYVKLSVIDDGCGMEKDVREHLFEPFFTTKEIGKGTGLGLATVYGIVRQNNGFIDVYSEPGMGSTFKIYLPRFYGKNIKDSSVKKEGLIQKGSETILLVEDEHDMMNMIKIMLERLGYMVLAAGTPGEALKIVENYSGTIHMLITDIVMPEMNGIDLAKKLLPVYGNMKCLFMSGYTSGVLPHTTIIEEEMVFIEKPFTTRELAEKIRKAMEQDRRH